MLGVLDIGGSGFEVPLEKVSGLPCCGWCDTTSAIPIPASAYGRMRSSAVSMLPSFSFGFSFLRASMMLPKISYRLRHPAIDVLLEVASAVLVVGLELIVRVGS